MVVTRPRSDVTAIYSELLVEQPLNVVTRPRSDVTAIHKAFLELQEEWSCNSS